jgi:hypothetical protein
MGAVGCALYGVAAPEGRFVEVDAAGAVERMDFESPIGAWSAAGPVQIPVIGDDGVLMYDGIEDVPSLNDC